MKRIPIACLPVETDGCGRTERAHGYGTGGHGGFVTARRLALGAATLILSAGCETGGQSPRVEPAAAVLALGSALGAPRMSANASSSGRAREGVAPPRLPSPLAKLKLATWNMAWLNAETEAGVVKRKVEDYDRIKGYVDRVGADIVAFQEVDGGAAAQRVFDPSRYDYHLSKREGPQNTGFAYRKHLRVTSNPDYTELDAGDVRYGADITVDLGSTTLRLLSVHLKAGCFDLPLTRTTHQACKKLSAQVPRLEAWIEARAAEGQPFAVLGDFNRRFFKAPRDPFWTEIDDGDPLTGDLWSPTEGERARCWNGKRPDFVDHLVLSKSARALMVPGSFTQHLYSSADLLHAKVLSDHCPLSVVLVPSGGTEAQPASSGGGAAPPAPCGLPSTDENPPPPFSHARVKGNISRGKKLYHVPECPGYGQTKIDEGRGERWFESVEEAEAAGWTRAGNCAAGPEGRAR